MATLFFRTAFQNETAERVMAGIIALSIFGNLYITTFTAGKGEEELKVRSLFARVITFFLASS